MATVLSNPAYDTYMGGATGAAKDQGETDDPLTNNVSYSGTVYYIDSENGDDHNSGLSPDQAWKTLAKAETKFDVGSWDTKPPNPNTNPPYHEAWTSAPSGSVFLFKRGGTYTGEIDVSPITNITSTGFSFQQNYTFGAYGDPTDPRPVIVSNTGTGVKVDSRAANVSFRDLHFVDGSSTPGVGMMLNNTNGVSIVNSEVEGFIQDGVTADGANNLTIQNSVFYNNSKGGNRGGGVTGGGINTKILNSSFINNGRDQVGAHDVYLRHLTDALVQGNLFVGGSNFGLVIHGTSDGITIRGNEFFGNNNGLSISGSGNKLNEVFNDVLIEDNIIHDNGYRPGEQGYGMILSSLTNAIIRNNEIYGNRLGSMTLNDGFGDQQSSNVQFYNNLFSGVVNLSTLLTTHLSLTNNIFTSPASSSSAYALIKPLTLLDSQLTLDYNLYFMPNKANGKPISYNGLASTVSDVALLFGKEKHGLYADPLFAAARDNNYTLLPGSPAINKGLAIPGLLDDLFGTIRPQGTNPDIGPYEYVMPPPTIAASANGSGAAAEGITTNNNIVGLVGVAATGSTVKVYDGTIFLGSTTPDQGGVWSYTTNALTDGLHILNATATDSAGRSVAALTVVSITIDTAAPSAPSVVSISNSSSAGGNILTLSGTAEARSTVNIYDGGILAGSAAADNSGAWTYTSPLWSNGVHSLTAIATDAAGNTGAASEATLAGSAGADTINGTVRNDTLYGFDGNDLLDGGAGSDTMIGGQGDDTYVVDSPADVVIELPGEGIDTIKTSINGYVLPEGSNVENLVLVGTISATGNSGNNRITGNDANNMFAGLGGADTFDGGGGTDSVTYAASACSVNVSLATGTGHGGDAEGDVLISIENLIGSAFSDTLEGDSGNNILTAGGGTDTVSYEHATAGVTVMLTTAAAQNTGGAGTDTLSGFWNIIGSAFNDALTGNQVANLLVGGAGRDTLDGGAGVDTVSYASSPTGVNVSLATGTGTGGDAEGDVLLNIENLTGSAFNDTLEGNAGANTLTGCGGIDTVSYEHAASAVNVSLALTGAQNTGGAGMDTLAGFENLTGSAFNDRLAGDANANVLNGGAGNDTVTYAASSAGVSVSLATGLGHGGDAEGDVLVSIENLIGSAFNDTLEGDGGNNVLTAGGGVDTVSYEHASAGVTVSLTTAAAQITGGAGTDTLSGFWNITGSAFNDMLTGNQLANELIGGAGDDTLNGGAGNDTLTGGSGRDTFVFNAGFGQDLIRDFQLGQDVIQIDRSVFPLTTLLTSAISSDLLGRAQITINAANTITLQDVSASDLKLHLSDIHIV